jgi:hypothetical protein
MTRLFGYGEDALTYWAITSKLDEILRTLGDKSYPSATIMLYRPGFGRRGGIDLQANMGSFSAEFGEFDAILGTPQAVYLVESKRDSPSRTRDYSITLTGLQSRRFAIMRWYLETWRESRPKDWKTFVARQETVFQVKFPGYRMAPAESRLAQNLEFVLRTLGECGAPVQDVLLFIGQAGSPKPIRVKPAGFKLVKLEYKPLVSSGYFQIQNPWTG